MRRQDQQREEQHQLAWTILSFFLANKSDNGLVQGKESDIRSRYEAGIAEGSEVAGLDEMGSDGWTAGWADVNKDGVVGATPYGGCCRDACRMRHVAPALALAFGWLGLRDRRA